MNDFSERTSLLIGLDGLEKLRHSTVAVFGLGGVGSFAVEALARAGVGKLIIVDNDRVNLSNVNRQLFALHSTIGKLKTEVAKQRIKDINQDAKVVCLPIFFDETTRDAINFNEVDYIVDCIDFVKSKVLLAKISKQFQKPLVCCLGTGNRLDNTKFEFADIFETNGCPLARKMRYELKKAGVQSLKVLISNAQTIAKVMGKVIPSISFVPSVAGLMIAGEVINDILKDS